jgi:hypothetical protein
VIRHLMMGLACVSAMAAAPARAADLPAYAPDVSAVEIEGMSPDQGAVHSTEKPAEQNVAAASGTEKTAVKSVPSEINLSMTLPSLTANADGSRNQASASMEGEMIVVKPGDVPLPRMVIELSGHIIKTVNSTARIDVTIGPSSRSFTWAAKDVASGRFTLLMDGQVPGGKVPSSLPVSAIAMVTKDPGSGAVWVSLEEIKVKLTKFDVADAQ